MKNCFLQQKHRDMLKRCQWRLFLYFICTTISKLWICTTCAGKIYHEDCLEVVIQIKYKNIGNRHCLCYKWRFKGKKGGGEEISNKLYITYLFWIENTILMVLKISHHVNVSWDNWKIQIPSTSIPKNVTEYSPLRDDLWFYETTKTDLYKSTEYFTHLHSPKATLTDYTGFNNHAK